MSTGDRDSGLGGLLATMAAVSALKDATGGGGGHNGRNAPRPGKIYIPPTCGSVTKHKFKLRGVHKVAKIKKRLLKMRLDLKSGVLEGPTELRANSAGHTKNCVKTLDELASLKSRREFLEYLARDEVWDRLGFSDDSVTSRMASKALGAGIGKLMYKLAS